MATPNVNSTRNLNCSVLIFNYNGAGIVNAQYLNCGDYTVMTIAASGGTPSSKYTTVFGVSASVQLTNGTVSVSSQIGGYTQTYQRYGAYTVAATAI